MPKRIDINTKVEELKSILETYNGVPSQKENRPAYTMVKYYVTHYGDDPMVKSLVEKYNISFSNRVVRSYSEKLEIVKAVLEEYQRVPSINDEPQKYSLIRDFFRTNKGTYEVDYLRYVYGFESCWPIPETKFKVKPAHNWDTISGASSDWLDWRSSVDYEYIEYVYARFGVLPAEKTAPMVRLNRLIGKWNRYGQEMWKRIKDPFYGFVKNMIDMGCNDERFISAYGSIHFPDDDVQERVRQMVIENGSCAVHYIAQTAIPNCPLSDSFVYYYYHNLSRGHIKSIQRHPILSFVPGGPDFASRSVLTVHYKDYHKCDIDKIRHLALSSFRNWIEIPPENLEEWKSWGACFFFHLKSYRYLAVSSVKEEISFDWGITKIQQAFNNGVGYCCHRYSSKDDLIDYRSFLIENGYNVNEEYFSSIN